MDSTIKGYKMSSRTSGYTKKEVEEEECDSTTEADQEFSIGEDVYYQEDTGQNVLGTIGMVSTKKVKVIFGDETEKWAPMIRIRKLNFSFPAENDGERILQSDPVPQPSQASTPPPFVILRNVDNSQKRKKSKFEEAVKQRSLRKENLPVTCGSCGTQKMLTSKKAFEFSPFTDQQYNCRKCINKSKTSKSNQLIAAQYMTGARGSTSSDPNSAIASPNDDGVLRTMEAICLHCRQNIEEKVSLHCTMCERPCHPSCLTLTPPPLPGDIFWSIICHVCGTQKPDNSSAGVSSQKLYSSRRNISTWSDVTYLILSCLNCKHPTERFFHLEDHILPFWEENLARLHLPRQYKTSNPEDRKRLILAALENANLRFYKDSRVKIPVWGIKEPTYRGFQMVKLANRSTPDPPSPVQPSEESLEEPPPVLEPMSKVGPGPAVTAAGFPIQKRNPAAASAMMTNIAQTIATQAAMAKIFVPPPKQSPSHLSTRTTKSNGPTTGSKSVSSPIGATSGRKSTKSATHQPVAKKTGTELNSGVQRTKNGILPQTKISGTKCIQDQPKAALNNVSVSPKTAGSASTSNAQGFKPTQSLQQSQKHVISPSSGGAARVTGVIKTSSTSPALETHRSVNTGSYPVRKKGSPPSINKSVRVEPVHVDVKRETNQQSNSFNCFDGENAKKADELIRESPGFNNRGVQIKRKISVSKVENSLTANLQESQDFTSVSKKVKIQHVPSSTDVTTRCVSSPPKSVEFEAKNPSESSTNGQKSPLEKLHHLIRKENGNLSVSIVSPSASGVPESINVLTFTDSTEHDDVVGTHDRTTTLVKQEPMFKTPLKNSHGATITNNDGQDAKFIQKEDDTKDITKSVTTSPRVINPSPVASPGSSTKLNILEKRITRPVRLKRTVVANAQKEKQMKISDANEKAIARRLNGKPGPIQSTLVLKNGRGRPKKPFKGQIRLTNGTTANNVSFNGPVETTDDSTTPNGSTETDFLWTNSSVSDLIKHGQGYRLECLPRMPDSREEMAQSAIKHFKEELTPRPPSYWSTSSNNHSKKPNNQRSRRDLKDLDSYYINGKRVDENGVQYQVVWRDGTGFECDSDEEEELETDVGSDYLCFEDYDFLEYFMDKMPVVSNNGDKCDKLATSRGHPDSSDKSVNGQRSSNTDGKVEYFAKVKAEPDDTVAKPNRVNGKKWADKAMLVAPVAPNCDEDSDAEPLCIDLTDSP